MTTPTRAAIAGLLVACLWLALIATASAGLAYDRQLHPKWRHCLTAPVARMVVDAEPPARWRQCYGIQGRYGR